MDNLTQNSNVGLNALDYEITRDSANNPIITKVNGVSVLNHQALIMPSYIDEAGPASSWKMVLNNDNKLGDILSGVPYGILNKTITGVGATTLELINQLRNSIIVVPTKSLAFSKSNWANLFHGENSAFYVGSSIGNINATVTKEDIRNYLDIRNGKKKKFLVVADSLSKLIEEIGEEINDFFLMIDEIDTMQIDSVYRERLENVIDYYFNTPFKNRCIVSATLGEFSDERFSKEQSIEVYYENTPKRNIKLLRTDNVDAVAVESIHEILVLNRSAKILVAYNSLRGIQNIINLLGADYERVCGILCSERSQDRVFGFVTRFNQEDNVIDKQIVFITCAYFAGVDIMERRHLISISTTNRPFSLLSPARLQQIAGRCRFGNITETIIYDIVELVADVDKRTFKEILLRKANKYSNALNSINALGDDEDMTCFVKLADAFLSNIGAVPIEDDFPVNIVRKNIYNEFAPAYFCIDALLERWEMLYNYYSNDNSLYEVLSKDNNVEYDFISRDWTIEQNESIDAILNNEKEEEKLVLNAAKEFVLDWISRGRQNDELIRKIFVARRTEKTFLMRFRKLMPFLNNEILLEKLIDNFDTKKFNILNDTVIFWALSEDSQFKSHTFAQFGFNPTTYRAGRGQGILLEPREILEKMRVVTSRNLLRTNMTDKTLAEMFKCFFVTKRINGKLKIISLHSFGDESPISRISEESELLRLFERM